MTTQSSKDYIIVASGVMFILIGFLINRYLYAPSKGESQHIPDQTSLSKTKLSKQEYKVLTLMADGQSNVQIADNLFISESTVKTHVSRILTKLKAKRRTEAIKIGRDLRII